MRLLYIMVFAFLVSAFGPLPLSDDRYDEVIKQSVRKWWAWGAHWHWWKAQLYQESRLDHIAVSHAGARGLAQFMPATWSDVQRQLSWSHISPNSARHSIDAGAYYMAKLHRNWSSPRPPLGRLKLAQASYNAGIGNILRAQNECEGALLYRKIIHCLPCVTGRHSEETITYVQRIEMWRGRLR